MSDEVFLKVVYEEDVEVVREASRDTCDADDISYTLTVTGIKQVEERAGWDFSVRGPVAPKYHVVWYRYGTGDSFHYENGRHEFVHACRTAEDADYLVRKLNKLGADKSLGFGNVRLTLPSGELVTEYPTWVGYFDCYESADSAVLDTEVL